MLNVVRKEVYHKCIKLPIDSARKLTMNDANRGVPKLVKIFHLAVEVFRLMLIYS
jgi:hypothetical protein